MGRQPSPLSDRQRLTIRLTIVTARLQLLPKPLPACYGENMRVQLRTYPLTLLVGTALLFIGQALPGWAEGVAKPKNQAKNQAQSQAQSQAEKLYLQAYAHCASIDTREAALNEINQAIKLDPGRVASYIVKAAILRGMEEDEEALQAIDQGLSLEPKNAMMLEKKAEILLYLRQYPQALATIDQAMALNHGKQGHLIKALVLNRLDRVSEAEKLAAYSIKINPGNISAWGIHADIAEKQKNWQAVITDRSHLLAHHSGNAFSDSTNLGSRARAYKHLGMYKLAIPDYQAALRNFPNNRSLHADLADIYKVTGDKANYAREMKAVNEFDMDIRPGKSLY